jgi:GNAT superfamily N-acetyltransferase
VTNADIPLEIDDDGPLDDARTLMREYAATLHIALEIPDFEVELAALPGKYAPPAGRLLVARSDGSPAGCVALRALGDEMAEVKRLYVREEFRRHKVGRALVEAVIAAARTEGYTHLRLDTHETMAPARRLYESFGFRQIDAYWDHPVAGVVFYELEL